MGVLTWWRRRSRAARFDLSVRIPLYAGFVVVPLLIGGRLGPLLGERALPVAALAAAQALTAVVLLHKGLESHLGKGPRPGRSIAVVAALTVATAAAGWPAYDRSAGSLTFTLLVLIGAVLAALSPVVRPALLSGIGLLGWLAAGALTGFREVTADGAGVRFLLIAVAVAAAYRVTIWMLDLIWQLEASQQVQAELAVAEERLRFARDLHDVVGRTLSVVALKAELAARLSRRGRPEAAEEMLEVRRIAQESLAELRTVVSGLRTAHFDAELAGARSLLASAGIDCVVTGTSAGLSPQSRTALGWAVREATTNVLRHSEATQCAIVVDRGPAGEVRLTMENNGTAGDRVRLGNGLTGLRERIAGVGGTVEVSREPPDRFRVEVSVPDHFRAGESPSEDEPRESMA